MPGVKSVIYSNVTGKEYRTSRTEDGRLYDHAIIALLRDSESPKLVLIVWRMSRYGTQVACLLLQEYDKYLDLLEGRAILIKWINFNRNRMVDKEDLIELIECWN